MQLSAPANSSDSHLAALLFPGATPAAASSSPVPASESSPALFAQLFPGLASGLPVAAAINLTPPAEAGTPSLASAHRAKNAAVGDALPGGEASRRPQIFPTNGRIAAFARPPGAAPVAPAIADAAPSSPGDVAEASEVTTDAASPAAGRTPPHPTLAAVRSNRGAPSTRTTESANVPAADPASCGPAPAPAPEQPARTVAVKRPEEDVITSPAAKPPCGAPAAGSVAPLAANPLVTSAGVTPDRSALGAPPSERPDLSRGTGTAGGAVSRRSAARFAPSKTTPVVAVSIAASTQAAPAAFADGVPAMPSPVLMVAARDDAQASAEPAPNLAHSLPLPAAVANGREKDLVADARLAPTIGFAPSRPEPVGAPVTTSPAEPIAPAAKQLVADAVSGDAPASAPVAVADETVGLTASALFGVAPDSPRPARELREENFAARAEKTGGEKNSAPAAAPKTFLNAAEKRVTPRAPDLGIDVAKTPSDMPAATFANRPAPTAVLSHNLVASAPVTAAEQTARSAPLVANDAPSAAHRAVEAVLTAAERFSAGDRHAVNLQFSVGGAELAVRVELRADQLRATFRTDSAELRTALAHEWQAVNADATDGAVRLAPPVFTSHANDSAASFTGDGAPRQRDPGARQSLQEIFGTVTSNPRAVSSAANPPDSSARARFASLPTALHLHTLA